MRSLIRNHFDFHRADPVLSTARGKLGCDLRLAASTAVAGEWDSVVDVRGGSPAAQSDADRKPAASTTANGLPTAVYDGTDVLVWPLSAGNNATTKLGFWFQYRPATVSGVQRLLHLGIGTGASSVDKLQIYATGAALRAEVYISAGVGRTVTTGSVLVAGAYHRCYFQYDSSRGGDANAVWYLNGALTGVSYANIGAGGTLTTLPAPTGNALIGGGANTDTPTQPIANGGELLGLSSFLDNLTAAEIAAWDRYERAA